MNSYSVFIPETGATRTRKTKHTYTHAAVVILRYIKTVSAWRSCPMKPAGTLTQDVTFHQNPMAAVRGERALASRYRNGWEDLFEVVTSYTVTLETK